MTTKENDRKCLYHAQHFRHIQSCSHYSWILTVRSKHHYYFLLFFHMGWELCFWSQIHTHTNKLGHFSYYQYLCWLSTCITFPLNSDAITYQHINEGAYWGDTTIFNHKITLHYKLGHPSTANMQQWKRQSFTVHLAMVSLPPYRRDVGEKPGLSLALSRELPSLHTRGAWVWHQPISLSSCTYGCSTFTGQVPPPQVIHCCFQVNHGTYCHATILTILGCPNSSIVFLFSISYC
jgi:hypothetical protein